MSGDARRPGSAGAGSAPGAGLPSGAGLASGADLPSGAGLASGAGSTSGAGLPPGAGPVFGAGLPLGTDLPSGDDREVDASLVRESLSGSRRARRALVRRHQHAVYNLARHMLDDPAAAAEVTEGSFVKAFRRLSAVPPSQRLVAWLLRIAHNTGVEALRRAGSRADPADGAIPPVDALDSAAAGAVSPRAGAVPPADAVVSQAAGAVSPRAGAVPPADAVVSPAAGAAPPADAAIRSAAAGGSRGAGSTPEWSRDALAEAFARLPMRYRAAIVLRYQAGLSFAEVGGVMGVPEETARARVESARRALAERLRPAPRP